MKATPTNSLVWGSVVTLLFAVMVVEASHFRYAHISWTRAPGTRTVTFVAETGWRQGVIDGNFGLNTGDGNYVNPSSYITLGTINSAAGPFDLVRATFVYTYQGDGPYTAQYTSCCRIGTLTISAGQSWLVETLVNLANNNNFSPTSGLPAVVAFKKGGIVTTSIPNTDLDSSAPLQCSLQGSTYGIVGYPIGLTVSSNCILSFDTSDSSIVVGNTYPVNIQVLDPTPGMSSFINVDFMIAITSNGGPSCTPVSQSVSVSCCGGACATTSTTFVVTDPDGDPVSWSLLSAVPGHSVSPGTSVPSGSTATITFTPPGGWVGPVSSGTLTIQDSFSNIGYCPYNFNSLASVMAVAITPNANPGNCPGYTLRCAGDNTASLTATVTGTCGAVTYSWSPGGQNTATISNLGAGTYTVTVNDGVQTATASYTITAPTPYTTSLTRTSAAFTCGHFQCNGQATASLQFTASGGSCNLGNPLPVLTWAGPVGIANNVAAPTGLVAGTYTATFQDSNNCPYVNTITLTQPSALSYTLSQTGNCGGVSLTAAVSGGCSPYTISWTSSSGTVPSGFTPSGLPSGTYTGTVTDANGCQLVRSITVSYTPLSVLIDAVDKTCGHITCDDSTDGALQSFVSGSCGPYTYVWTSSPGATVIPTGTVNPTGLKAGSYYLTVTDNGGNSLRSNTEILAAPSDLMISLTQYPKVCGHITCRGSSDGRLTVNQLAPGCGTINLSWASTGTAIANNNFNPTGLGPGTYTPTVTDANGCSFTAPSVSISQPATALTVAVTQFPRSCGHIICNGDANGRLLVTPAGGCAGYSITWTSTGTAVAPGNFNPTNLRPGVYTPTVTDQNGCTVTPGSYTIAEPSTVLTGSISQSSCGQLTLSVSGGCGPYTYSWTTTGGSGLNPTSQNQAGPLSPGTYQVVVTDANGCSITRSFTIQPLAIDSGMSVVASDWGNSGSPPVVGSPWVRGPQPDQVTSATLQFAVYPSDFTVLQTPSISLRITALSGTVTGLWGIAMGYTGPASPYYLLTWNGVSSIPGCSAVTPGLKLLYVPAGSSACSIAEVSNGVILLESSASYGHTAWPAVTPLDFVLLYNTGVNVIRASVGGVAQFLFSSTVGHSLNAAVPTSLIAGGKWGLVTFSQDNVLFSKLARDAVVTTCPDAALAVVRKNFSGVSLCSAANSDISVNWGDSTPVETYTGGTAIVSFNSGSNTGTLQVQHRYATQGSYTVTVCVVASFGSSSACDSFIVSVSDLFTVGVTKKNMLMYTKGMLNWDTVTTGVDPMVRGELREKPARGGAVAMVLGTSSYSSGEMHLEAIHGILPGKYDLHLVLIAGACDFADSPIDFCVYLPFGENKCN